MPKFQYILKVFAMVFMVMVNKNTMAQTTTLDIDENETTLPGNVADAYDRICLKRDIPAERWTVFTLPADLDGYYFGADAERYEVRNLKTDDDGTLVLDASEMYLEDDFVAGHTYVVYPKYGTSMLTLVTAGMKTPVNRSCSELICKDATGWNNDSSGIESMEADKESIHAIYDLSGRKTTMDNMKQHGGILIADKKKIVIHKH